MKKIRRAILLLGALLFCAAAHAQMVPGLNGVMFATAGKSVVVSAYQGTGISTTAGATQTISGVNFGTAAGDRRIVAAIQLNYTSGSVTASSVTIGGVTATIVVTVSNTGTGRNTSLIAIASVPTGTSGNVVITASGSCSGSMAGIVSVTGLTSATPTSTGSAADSSTLSTSLNVPAGGFAVGVAGDANGGTGHVWSGITKQNNQSVGGFGDSTAYDSFVAAQTGLTVQVSGLADSRSSMAAASWGN